LTQLATWCLRYAPLVAADAADGLWIDATACVHLAGDEDALLADLVHQFKRARFAARVAITKSPGAAHAVARYGGGEDKAVVPEAGLKAALEPLPVQALRLPPAVIDGLRRLGFDHVGDLIAAPCAPLMKRFDSIVALRRRSASSSRAFIR